MGSVAPSKLAALGITAAGSVLAALAWRYSKEKQALAFHARKREDRLSASCKTHEALLGADVKADIVEKPTGDDNALVQSKCDSTLAVDPNAGDEVGAPTLLANKSMQSDKDTGMTAVAEKNTDSLNDDLDMALGHSAFDRQVSIQIANAERMSRLWLRGLSCRALGHVTGENDEAWIEFLPDEGPRFVELYEMSVEIVGSGGFALPYPGFFRGQPCIVKVVDKELVGDEYRKNLVEAGLFEVLLRMSQEQEHPNIVSYFDFLEGPLNYYVVMQQLQGSDLFDQFLADYPVTEGYIRDLMHQVFSSLRHIHDVVGLVHRDVKLENFRFAGRSARSELKLLDFGFARRSNSPTEEKISGTLLYLAPEVVAMDLPGERRRFDTASDLWAAGIMLFVFLCGKEPFKEQEVWELAREGGRSLVVKSMRNMALKRWSADVRDLIEKLLTINPSERITASQALLHPWFSSRELTAATSTASKQVYHLARETSRRSTVFKEQKLDSVAKQKSSCHVLLDAVRSQRSIQFDTTSDKDLQELLVNPENVDQLATVLQNPVLTAGYKPQQSSNSLGSNDDHLFAFD